MHLQGFNNLSKSLAITLYKAAYIDSPLTRKAYINNISGQYSAETLSIRLTNYANSIGGQILNTATKNYLPQGASATLMIAEAVNKIQSTITPTSIVNHLDKSHICVHTYPEELFNNGVAIFRADIEISTCGIISPLKLVNCVMQDFSPDLINFDYRVRGFNRLGKKNKQYLDHAIESIQQYIDPEYFHFYHKKDINSPKINLFHTSLLRKELVSKLVLANCSINLPQHEKTNIENRLMIELAEIYYHE